MADEEQVARLKRSVDEWNRWRKQNSILSSDLSGANLSGANLSGADLTSAELSEAILTYANLSGAILTYANLTRANLTRADLTYTDLILANLSEAILSGATIILANLSGAILSGSILSGAILTRTTLIEADLGGATLNYATLNQTNLSGATLNYANLNQTNLNEANLGGTNLSDTNLSQANLSQANLSQANLSQANLSQANLSQANLSQANLSQANLSQANLSQANLSQANFARSRFDHTLFAEVDLSTVQELETTVHRGPSTVNINSVIFPHDEPTRTHFLRGVGFTETQIDYLPSLLTPRPIQYHSLFISYAHEDEVIAQRLHTDLRKKNVPCWFAPHDLRPGNYLLKHIDQAIHTQDKILLLLSKHSIESAWVEHEVEVALRREISPKREILFPFRLDDAIFSCTTFWAMSLKDLRQIGDFTGWQEEQRYQEAFTLLLHDLKTEPSPPPIRIFPRSGP